MSKSEDEATYRGCERMIDGTHDLLSLMEPAVTGNKSGGTAKYEVFNLEVNLNDEVTSLNNLRSPPQVLLRDYNWYFRWIFCT